MTNAERQWLARVMRTITHVAFREHAVGSSVRNGAAEDVLRAVQSLIQVTGQPAANLSVQPSLPDRADELIE